MAPARTLFYGLVLLLGPFVLIWLASTFERPFICPYDAAISGRLTALVVAECGLALHRKQTRRLVPRIVHQIWKDTNLLAAPTKVLESIVSFNHLNEGHVYVLWTDGDLDMFVRKYFRDLWKLWKSLPHPIFRADLARYLLLKHFGGLYSDCDTRCLKPIDTWFGESGWDERIGAVVGIETDGSKTKNWKAVYPRELHICQWTIASAPNHPFIKGVVDEAVRRLRLKVSNVSYMSTETAVQNTAGPTLFTDQVYSFLGARGFDWKKLLGSVDITRVGTFDEGQIVILPITGFSPGVGHMGAGSNGDPMAKVEHRFLGTWRGESKDEDKPSPLRKEALADRQLRTLFVPGADVDLTQIPRTIPRSSWPEFKKLGSVPVKDKFDMPSS